MREINVSIHIFIVRHYEIASPIQKNKNKNIVSFA